MAQITKEDNRWLISGPMSMSSIDALLAEGAALTGAKELEIDLSAVSEVDTATISLLFEWLRQAHGRKSRVVYTNLPEKLVSLASLYGVLDLIPQPHSSTASH